MSKKPKKHVPKTKRPSGSGISEANRGKIIRALNNGRFVARTVGGIARETSLSKGLVIKSLKVDEILRGQMKIYPRKTSDGKVLLTTKKHFSKKAGFKDKFIDVFATNRVTLNDID